MKLVKGVTTILVLSSVLFSSCEKNGICINGEGALVTKTISIAHFSEIDLQEAGKVIITQGPVQEVKVTGHQNIIDRLETNVSGNRWDIDLENGCYNNYDLTIRITVPNMQNVVLSGSGSITLNNFEDQGNLSISIPGSGDITMNSFDGTENLNISISGSGDISAYSVLPDLKNTTISISGSGNINGFPLMTDNADVLISGSGNVNVGVESHLDVLISGSGNIYYIGYPTITSKITGSGNIISAN